MNVIQKSLTDEAIEDRDYRDYLTITIDGKESFCVYDGESEDATLARDFNDCWGIVDLMKKAYDAGIVSHRKPDNNIHPVLTARHALGCAKTYDAAPL